jgi:hypothetical protein
MNIMDIGNTLLAIARDPAWGAIGTLTAQGAATDSRLIVIPLIISLPLVVFWLWMAWDLGGNDDITGNEKLNWALAFIFLSVFAAVFYYVNVYRNRKRH